MTADDWRLCCGTWQAGLSCETCGSWIPLADLGEN